MKFEEKTSTPTVAHVCVPYLQATETFIYDRIAHPQWPHHPQWPRHPQRFRSVVATNEPVIHRDLFPHPAVSTMADRPALVRKANAAWQRWFGYSPWYLGALRREGAGVIHAHYGPVGCSVLRVKEKLRLPLMTSFYGQDASALLRDPRYEREYRRLFARCEMISVLSEDMKSRMIDAGCPPERIAIHHLAVDTD
ncbi:MAG: glycosyltransferase, partial [bacterium]